MRLFEIGFGVDINVHDAFEMGEDRHARLGLHPRDQAFAAARHDHVDGAVEAGQHGADGGAVAGGNELDARLGQARFLEPGGEAGMDQPRGVKTLRASAQNGGVARFQAQPAGVGGDIGAAFENHPDHAERRRDALDAQAVGPLERLQRPADRVRQIGDFVEAARDGGDALVVEHQPVEHGGAEVLRPGLGHVESIGLEQFHLPGEQDFGGGAQGEIFLFRGGERQHARGLAGLATDRHHDLVEIGGPAVHHIQAFHRHCPSVCIRLKLRSEI